ncbi:thiaminase II [Spirosoma taeanense]|uniref:Aminopyrimidine aminohydrolase n=1 Tax=Spirosoma taeanense TaxID=2735870 RepID=A0A6M5Y091_9BACT|nr:thiaminase II [Spirosoma taeanense]QJW88198.1 thiaminase II [Spirosoma taeanense]
MHFTDQLWQQITPLYETIVSHGFVQELAAGSLPAPKFQYYIQQDALYLTDFSRALAQLSVKASAPADILQFTEFAANAIRVERILHETNFDLYNIQPETQKKPACFAYTNFLLAMTATQSLAVGAAAVLPCFWIYREVGKYIHAQSRERNPYQAWIDTYAGDAFDQVVGQMLDLTERLANEASSAEQEKMQEAFVQSSRLEWYFWNDAYQLTDWLV